MTSEVVSHCLPQYLHQSAITKHVQFSIGLFSIFPGSNTGISDNINTNIEVLIYFNVDYLIKQMLYVETHMLVGQLMQVWRKTLRDG